MKARLTTWHDERGSLTLTALSLTAVIAIALGSYIALCYQSYQHSARTMLQREARQLAETGLEEALWALNNASWGSAGPSSNVAWTTSGGTKSCTLTGYSLDNGATGQLALTVSNYNGNAPTITAVATVTLSTGTQLKKTLTATSRPAPLFPSAIGIVSDNNGRVTFSAAGTVDSWSSNPSGDNSTFVTYSWTGANSNYVGTLAAPSITLNGATVYGYTQTFGNSITTTASSQVKGPSTAVGTKVDPTRVGKSAFVPVYPVSTPSSYTVTGYLDGSNQTIGTAFGTTEYWVAGSGLTLNTTTVTVQGPVVMIIGGDLTMFSGAKIVVNSTGNSRAEIFVSGNVSIGISPAGSTTWLNNQTNVPKNLILYSTSTSSSRLFNYYNNHDFCGVMYSASPGAPIVFDTGVANTISGAILAAYNVTFNASTSPVIHYDTALQTLPKGWFKGVTTPYVILQITET